MPAYTQNILFSDWFGIQESVLADYGAFNGSLLSDLPLFIDPFLLFNSTKSDYQKLHQDVIRYLDFLREKATSQILSDDALEAYFHFSEVKETWLGFSVVGNSGRGLGSKFANALNINFNRLFSHESDGITHGRHLEKLCLIDPGIGRDNISDFTTNLIKEFLLNYTQDFAKQHLDQKLCISTNVPKVRFNYTTETWESKIFYLPVFGNQHVLLVPRNLLSKDNTWINHDDLIADFEELPHAISDGALRGSINNYFLQALPDRSDKKNKEPTKKDRAQAAKQTINHFPEIIDYYIKYKEDHGDKAVAVSNARVDYAEALFLKNFTQLAFLLAEESDFYKFAGDTLHSAIKKALCLKEVIEKKGGSSYFYDEERQLVNREADIRIAHRFTWLNRPFENLPDKSSSSRRAAELPSDLLKRLTPVDFKLATNTNLRKYFLKRNKHEQKEAPLETVVVLFHQGEIEKVKVQILLTELGIPLSPDVVFINLQQREHNRILEVTEQSMSKEPNPRAIFFTALPVEFQAVRNFLSDVHEVQGLNGCIYEKGIYNHPEYHWDVFLVETGAGNVDSAIEAAQAINQTDPDVVFFVGVAGGVKDVKLGDVVAATKIYAYESGADKEIFQPRPLVGESSYMLTQRAKAEARNPDWLTRLDKNSSKPNVFVGPIAAGEKVVKSTLSDTYRLIRTHYSDVLAVEMEGHGLLRAARASSVNAIVIRGISDLIDDKELVDAEGSQERAALHASTFAFQMLSKLKPIVQL